MILVVFTAFLSSCGSNQEAVTYINNNGHSYTTSSVTTPRGHTVGTWKYNELTSQEITDTENYINSEASKKGWSITKLRQHTLMYNCHSYAWYSQSISNVHWINDPSPYWYGTNGSNGSYTIITSVTNASIPSSVANGSKVVYADSSGSVIHSAIKTSSTKFQSKWGWAGLYEHSSGHSPYSTATLYYFKYYK